MILDNLEMLTAFAVVMLGVSLLVTILTQMVSSLLGSRGTNLRWGLIQVLQTVHPEFAKDIGGIVDRVLTHPLISDSTFSRFRAKIPVVGRWQLATGIRIEELVGALEKLSAGATPLPAGAPPPLTCTAEQAMATMARDARANAGVELQVLAAQVKQFLGAVSPAAAVASAPVGPSGVVAAAAAMPMQQTIKIDDLIGKFPAAAQTALEDLKGWFQPTMDRVSQRFALQMRIWTIVFAVVIAFGFKLDSFDLLGRLSTDAKLRAGLASSYAALSAKVAEVPATTENKPTIQELSVQAAGIRGELQKAGFRLYPDPYDAWSIWPGFGFNNPHFWGVLFSAAMLSLGSPFWFNALKSLANLRPVLANKQEKESKAPAAA